MATTSSTPDHGPGASPTRFSARRWKQVALNVKRRAEANHTPLIAAGVAFYGLLSVFPGIAALISIWALTTDPQGLIAQLEAFARALPPSAAQLLTDQARSVAQGADAGTGFAALIGIALALWAASRGVVSLMEGINIAYGEKDERGPVRQNLVALGLTLTIVLGMAIAVGIIVILPAVLDRLALGGWDVALRLLPWPVLFAAGVALLAVIYRTAPDRKPPHWRWLSPGAIAAMVLWVVGSVAFQIYVANFGAYNATYGALGGVIVLLLWLWLSALFVLLGAEINAESERQAR